VTLLDIKSMLSDAVCIHAIVAFSAYQQSLNHSRGAIDQSITEAAFHHSEAARLLNKKFENPKEALSIPSLIAAAVIGSCVVRV
jgi:hypothetical protein